MSDDWIFVRDDSNRMGPEPRKFVSVPDNGLIVDKLKKEIDVLTEQRDEARKIALKFIFKYTVQSALKDYSPELFKTISQWEEYK